MRWDEFIASERGQGATMLDDAHCYRIITGRAESFEDHGWPHREGRDGMDLVIQGIQINHRTPDGNTCGGHVNFARPLNPSDNERTWEIWQVQSLDPLTISPSVLCHCGEHGFIREGRWVSA